MSICDWHHIAFSDSVIKSWHLKNINLKKFLIYYYLFPCGCAGSVSLCGLSSSCGGKDYSLVAMCGLPIAAASPAVERGLCSFSCCGARALQLLLLWSAGSAARGLQQLCLLGLEHGLAVLAHGLSCSMAVGPSLNEGLNPCLLHWQAGSLLLSLPEKPTGIFIVDIFKFLTMQQEHFCYHFWLPK